jgi:hypothetical protein
VSRVPERYATRNGYACATVLAALVPATGLAGFIFITMNPLFFAPLLAGSLAIPYVLARWLWPTGRRTAAIMAGRGALVTLGSLFGGGFLAGLMMPFMDPAPLRLEEVLAGPVVMGAMGVLFGSILTFGVPWILGIGISLLFRDRPQ